MRKFQFPTTEENVRSLKAGDELLLQGVLVTGRDVAHKFMVEKKPDFLKQILKGTAIYHCGPIVKQTQKGWEFVSAGPTTSIREEPYEAEIIKYYGVRGIIGKGGMGPKTLDACHKFGCVYLHAVGGAACLLAESVIRVKDVYKLKEFGTPEAFWVIKVKDFPVVVTMDSYGNSLHEKIQKSSTQIATKLISKIG